MPITCEAHLNEDMRAEVAAFERFDWFIALLGGDRRILLRGESLEI